MTKTSLKKVLGLSVVTLQEVCTLIKAILNDHPLTALSSDSNDLQLLTPSHLLFCFHITALPRPSLDAAEYDLKFSDAHTASLVQQRRSFLYNHFKQCFQKEYLSLLREVQSHQMKKTHVPENVVQVRDVVLIADNDKPRLQWQLGVVEKLLTGTDHICRAIAIHWLKGHTALPLLKLHPVELNVIDCLKDSNKIIYLNLAHDEVT